LQGQKLTPSIIVSPAHRHSRHDRSGDSQIRRAVWPSLGLTIGKFPVKRRSHLTSAGRMRRARKAGVDQNRNQGQSVIPFADAQVTWAVLLELHSDPACNPHWGCDTPGVHSQLSNRCPDDTGVHFLSFGV